MRSVTRARVPEVCAPRMVGREHELAALAEALAAPPAIVFVEGEAGIGKSRLVGEFLSPPAGQSARLGRVLVACCPPFRQPCTLGPVVDAVRQAADNVSDLRLTGLAGTLRPLFPEWADDLPAAPEPLTDPTAARHRLFRALGELIDRLQVAMLVVEDAHWADEATLEFLLFLASRSPQQVSLLVTCRPEEVPDDSPLRRLSSRAPAGTTCARVLLEPLDVTGTTDLISSMLGGDPVSAEFAAFLHEHTDGLPLAIEESVRLLRDRRDLRNRGGGWERQQLGALHVPPTVRDAVLERAARLSAPAQAILRTAAVLADTVAEDILLAVSGLPTAQAASGLAETLSTKLLDDSGRGVGYRHALACRAVYETIPARHRAQIHLRAARVLEGTSPLPVTHLARHFREAGETDGWRRYAEQAADLAEAAGDHATVSMVLHDLVTHATLPPAAVVRLAQRIRLYLVAGPSHLDDLAQRLRCAIDTDSLTEAERAEAHWHLARILLNTRQYPAGVAQLEQALPGLAHRPAEVARAMTQLGVPYHTLWPTAVHRRWLDKAAEIIAASPIPAAERLEFTVTQATALLLMGEESGWALAAEIPDATSAPQQAEYIMRGSANIGNAAMLWGRYDEAKRRLTAGLELGERLDCRRLSDGIKVILAHLDWFTGAWSGLANRVAALPRPEDPDPALCLDAVLVAGLLDAAAGAYRAAEQKLRAVLAEEAALGVVDLPLEPAAALAQLALAAGRVGEALELTDDPTRVITSKGIWVWATEIAPVRVQALVAAGRHGEAAGIIGAFAEGLHGRDAPAPRAALTLCRGLLAKATDNVRAAALFSHAADAWDALPRPYDALLAREHQAGCLLATSQRDPGLSLLASVRQALITLGARGDADRVVATLREHGVAARRAQRGGKHGYGGELSPREREVVEVLAATGHSNREIAETLVLSPKTVARHLDSAMRKLHVSSRTALAMRAVEDGLVAASGPAPR